MLSLSLFSFNINLWCDHVIEAPEEMRIKVFNSGTFNGLNGLIAFGGHSCPSSIVGEILLWKNAQKNATKNKISDVINSSMPSCSPLFTFFVWFPCLIASFEMSIHHMIAVSIVAIVASCSVILILVYIQIIVELVTRNAQIDAISGHGLFSTIWYKWNFFIILIFCGI